MIDSREKKYWFCGIIIYHSVIIFTFCIMNDSAAELFFKITDAKTHVMLFAFPYQLLLALGDKYMTIPMVIRFGSREKIWEERVKTAYIWGGIYMGIWLVFLFVACTLRPGYLQDFPVGTAISRVLHLFCNILILCSLSLIFRMSGNVKLAKGAYPLALLALCAETLGLERWIKASTNIVLNLLFNWAYHLNFDSLIIQIILICVMLLLLRRLCMREDLL